MELTILKPRQAGKSYIFKIMKNSLYGKFGLTPPPELELDEGRLHGSRYYTVRAINCDWPAMERWCYDNFGEPGDVWAEHDFTWPETPRWLMNNSKFWFRHEKDRNWFLMR